MIQSGAGVEVIENKHYLACRVYLPWEFVNQTRGLFGNWTFDMSDDFALPQPPAPMRKYYTVIVGYNYT